MDRPAVNWSRWTRIKPFGESEEHGVLRLDILSLRSLVIYTREEGVVADQELRSKVQILWKIGCDVIRRYTFGYDCIEMMRMLAYFNSPALNARVFESEVSRTLVMMLKDAGFLTMRRIQSPSTILISTQFPALVDEIREKNVALDVEFLRRNILILCSCRTHVLDHSQHWHELMTRIWQHALTHGIEFIRDNTFKWEDYLKDLLEYQRHELSDGQKEVLSGAVEIFDGEYGNMDGKTMELRFTQLRLLKNGGIDMWLNYSKHYRLLLETVLMTSHRSREYNFGNRVISRHASNPRNRIRSKQQEMAELIYEKALQIRDLDSRTLLLEEALAYCTLGNQLWRSTIPNNYGDECFSVSLKCWAQLGKWDEMLGFVREIREILMRHRTCITMPWFPDSILECASETDGKEMILNELSIFLNHNYNMGRMGFWEQEYETKSLIKYEGDLKNWDRILIIMRERREFSRAQIIAGQGELDLENWVQLESTLLDLIEYSSNGLVGVLVNESLEFTKQLVEFRINNGTYGGEKYSVEMSTINRFKDDPLVHVIKICLVKFRHEQLLSYMLEYEKLLEEKYGDRVGPITNGILLFGQWFRAQLLLGANMNNGEKFVKLLQGVKATTQNRIAIISNHPTQIKSWMEGYADLICRDCDKYIPWN